MFLCYDAGLMGFDMDNNLNCGERAGQTQGGDQNSMGEPAQAAKDRLFTYIYRLVLDEESARGLLKESLEEISRPQK